MNRLFKMIAKLFAHRALARPRAKSGRKPKRKGQGGQSSLVSNAHQDFMAQTSGAPASSGCISPVYLSNNNNFPSF